MTEFSLLACGYKQGSCSGAYTDHTFGTHALLQNERPC